MKRIGQPKSARIVLRSKGYDSLAPDLISYLKDQYNKLADEVSTHTRKLSDEDFYKLDDQAKNKFYLESELL